MRGLCALAVLQPGAALACALPPSVVMTLRTGYYMTGAAATVAVTALLASARLPAMRAGWQGTQVLAMRRLPSSAIAFVTLALAALTFDGLSKTFLWMGLIGVNPLEFPGRSAVMGINTVGLLAVWALTSGTILGALWLGRRMAGVTYDTAPIMFSFLAIAAGYHGAHYLVTLLTTGQYTLAALNDPFFRGDSMLGLPASTSRSAFSPIVGS